MARLIFLVECVMVGGLGALALFWIDAPATALWIWGAVAVTPILIAWRAPIAAYAFVRIAMPVLFGAASVIAYDSIHATPELSQHILEEVKEYDGEQYYAVISTLFAILTALILVKGIEAFDRLNAVIGEEANRIRSIVEFMYYFEEEDGEPVANIADVKRRTRRIRELMNDYCIACLDDPTARNHERSNELLRRATQEVGALDCVDENDRLALAEVMRGVNSLFTIRARRVAASRAKVPLYMLVALVFMSLAIVFPFFIGDPDGHPYAQAFIFVLTTFCTFVLVLLRDINAPFEGFWQVDLHPYQSVKEDLEGLLLEPEAGYDYDPDFRAPPAVRQATSYW